MSIKHLAIFVVILSLQTYAVDTIDQFTEQDRFALNENSMEKLYEIYADKSFFYPNADGRTEDLIPYVGVRDEDDYLIFVNILDDDSFFGNPFNLHDRLDKLCKKQEDRDIFENSSESKYKVKKGFKKKPLAQLHEVILKIVPDDLDNRKSTFQKAKRSELFELFDDSLEDRIIKRSEYQYWKEKMADGASPKFLVKIDKIICIQGSSKEFEFLGNKTLVKDENGLMIGDHYTDYAENDEIKRFNQSAFKVQQIPLDEIQASQVPSDNFRSNRDAYSNHSIHNVHSPAQKNSSQKGNTNPNFNCRKSSFGCDFYNSTH